LENHTVFFEWDNVPVDICFIFHNSMGWIMKLRMNWIQLSALSRECIDTVLPAENRLLKPLLLA
jgi:hypothetical protein